MEHNFFRICRDEETKMTRGLTLRHNKESYKKTISDAPQMPHKLKYCSQILVVIFVYLINTQCFVLNSTYSVCILFFPSFCHLRLKTVLWSNLSCYFFILVTHKVFHGIQHILYAYECSPPFLPSFLLSLKTPNYGVA